MYATRLVQCLQLNANLPRFVPTAAALVASAVLLLLVMILDLYCRSAHGLLPALSVPFLTFLLYPN